MGDIDQYTRRAVCRAIEMIMTTLATNQVILKGMLDRLLQKRRIEGNFLIQSSSVRRRSCYYVYISILYFTIAGNNDQCLNSELKLPLFRFQLQFSDNY